ncbi:Vitamin B12 import ATP-binding protein BtuD [Streptomyces fumanus]
MDAVTASLEVSGLAFAYPDGHQALFGVDFTVARGERVALLGPNGAGKTTLVLHLNGILTGGAGTVRVAGLPVDRKNMAEIRRRVGIVFQDPDDQLFMPTVREDVAFGPAAAGLKGAELEARAWTGRSPWSAWASSRTVGSPQPSGWLAFGRAPSGWPPGRSVPAR